ncbi:MAG: sigma-54-dependent Fis family transcriptional regulator [Bacteroidetes bacterium]|nr:sigma-54-dependent Fis family transcriptional regulator [Bacteroidota bacterium]
MNITQAPVPIFVVENSNVFVKMLDYIFSKDIVFKFYEFKSEEECLKNLDKNPAVVIIDHALSGIMNASDTIQQIKSYDANIHIIALLNSTEEKLAAKLLNAGASDYVFKDTQGIEVINSKLETFLEKRNVKKPFFIKEVKPSLKSVGYFLLILIALSLGVYYYK